MYSIKLNKKCVTTKTENSSVLIFWIAMSVLFDFFSINVYRCRQKLFFFLQKFLVLYFLIMLIHVQSIGIYLLPSTDNNRTSEWKVQSKLLISWEHLSVLKIDWNDQKLKQFLWIVYCNTHSFLDKSNLNHYENKTKKKIISISVVAYIGCGEYRSLWSHFFEFFL